MYETDQFLDPQQVMKIRREVPLADIYVSLAEEASELAQAALKMYRIHSNANPTNISENEAYRNLIEEYGDLLLDARDILGLEPDRDLMRFKLNRWCERIDDARKE